MMDDSGSLHRDSLYYWAGQMGTAYGDLLIANLLIEDSLTDSANIVYNNILTKYTVDSVEANDFIQGRNLMDLLITQREKNANLFVLDSAQVDTLHSIVANSHMWARVRAESWLNMYNGTPFNDTLLYPGDTSAKAITGTGFNVCVGGTASFSDASAGGIWSIEGADTAVASVSSAGVVSGISAGTATLSYNVGLTYATAVLTVNSLPTAITGNTVLCPGATIALSDTTAGGTWSSGSNAIAAISSTGVVSGLSAGTTLISYAVPTATVSPTSPAPATACAVTIVLTVSSIPSAITGSPMVCPAATTALSDGTPNGIWSSANMSVATISSSGTVSGVSTGTATVSYSETGVGCVTTTDVTVNALPSAIAGATLVCQGATTVLTDATPYGNWSSSDESIATVSSTGTVSGVSTGTASITYVVGVNGCPIATSVTVTTVTLSDATSGGTWTSSNSGVATVGSASGTVAGVSNGNAPITYSIAGVGCYAVAVATVDAFTAGTVNGASTVVVSLTTTLTDAVAGGLWSASNSNATVGSSTGVVTGVTAGTVIISYTVASGCGSVTATKVVSVNPVGAIGGTASVCVGATTNLNDAPGSGTWHSSNTFVATVGTSGIVTGVSAGTSAISYTVSGVTASVIVTVNSLPSSIGGAISVCNGSTITLSDFTSGGTWTSTSGISVTTGTTVTTVTGLTDGTNTVSYTLSTGCYKTYAVTVKTVPTAILGNLAVCGVGSVTFLSDATTGTSWNISPVGTATVSASGRVYGVSTGTAVVTYTATDGCIATAVTTVNALLTVSAILGANNVSHGATISLSDTTGTGTWSSSNTAIGSVDASGNVTGVGTSGTVNITYSVVYGGGGCLASNVKSITVHTPAPHAAGGSTTTSVGAVVGIAREVIGGTWISSDDGIATVDANGVATGVTPGTVNIIHTVTNNDGSVSTTVTELVVNSLTFDVRLQPNPNKGTFTLSGSVGTNRDEPVTLEISDMLGQTVYNSKSIATGGVINEQIVLNSNLANGMYLLNVQVTVGSKVFHFVLEK